MDLEKKIAEIEKKAAADVARARQEVAVRRALNIQPSSVSLHGCHGRAGTLTYGEGSLVALLAALPPLPVIQAKGAYRTFVHDADVLKDERGYTEFLPIAPVMLRCEKLRKWPAKVCAEWFTRVEGQGVFSVQLTLKADQVYFNAEWKTAHGETYVSRDEFTHGYEGRPKVINWAAGSSEYLKNRTLTWSADVDVAALLTAVHP